MTGRDPTGQALAVPATPANAVDGPLGFDPSRGEVWTRAFCAYIASFNARASTAINAADECLAAFDERFGGER